MSKINEIENKIQELSGGAFQKLVNAYLTKEYQYLDGTVMPVGSVAGSNKTRKGTPDTLISFPNDTYILAEHTTEKKGVVKKFQKNLINCLDQNKTGIKVKKIRKILLFWTYDFKTPDIEELRQQGTGYGVDIEPIGLQTLSHKLRHNYPGIAQDHLGVELDTGQILDPNDFVRIYDRHKYTPPLNTAFFGREHEVQQILDGLERADLIIVSGAAGVGKSRLALECSRRFIQGHPEYTVRCIFNKGSNIRNDLQVYFSEPGSFLIFVDDANRLSEFNRVLGKLIEQRENQQIKIIVTVRDYALEQVRAYAKAIKEVKEIEVESFTDEEIQNFLKATFNIQNYKYLDRINEIAEGNSRLAVMAARIINVQGTFESIRDVTNLYDEYFSSIRKDLIQLKKRKYIKVAAIVGFYGHVDQKNKKQVQQIETLFGVKEKSFWKIAKQLCHWEVLDMFEDEVVKPADQNLAEYLFYLVFFREKLLDFGRLFEHCFPLQQDRIIEMFRPITKKFKHKEIHGVVRPVIQAAWERYEKEEDETNLIELLVWYGPVLSTKTLNYVKTRIENLENAPLEVTSKWLNPSLRPAALLGMLQVFEYASDENFQIVIDLVLAYAMKCPNHIEQVTHLLTEDFGVKHDSHRWNYSRQGIIVDTLTKRTKEDNTQLFGQLLLNVAHTYLKVHFTRYESGRKGTWKSWRINVLPIAAMIELRTKIWNSVLRLMANPKFKKRVLVLIYDYSGFMKDERAFKADLLAKDAQVLLPYITEHLVGQDLHTVVIIQGYLNLLEKEKVPFDAMLRISFTTEAFQIYRILTRCPNFLLKALKEEIDKHFSEYRFVDYQRFFRICQECQDVLHEMKINSHHDFFEQIFNVLACLADRDQVLFLRVVCDYLGQGEFLTLKSIAYANLVNKLIEVIGANETYAILCEHDYPNKTAWLMAYYRYLPSENVTQKQLEGLYTLYREGQRQHLNRELFDFEKFREVDGRVVPKIAEILMDRIEQDEAFRSLLWDLLNQFNIKGRIRELFMHDVELLKRAYLIGNRANHDSDEILNQILDVDRGIIEMHINRLYTSSKVESNHHRRYGTLWLRDDYKAVMERMVTAVVAEVKQAIKQNFWERFWTGSSILKSFFDLHNDEKNGERVEARQDLFLKEQITTHTDDHIHMKVLFEVITWFAPERRRSFIGCFLEYNQQFEDFKALPLQSNGIVYSGSLAPSYQERIDFLQSLLPLLNSSALLPHRNYVEELIQEEKKSKRDAQKIDFIRA